MTYKETLFFIAKCLVINLDSTNNVLIENHLKSGNIDWDAIVKVSANHYVYPALYCNLKRANFLKYVPEDLIEHMIYITDLNRERNLKIINQAKEINELLVTNNITPIFFKGASYLLEELYEDIAERMLGDIDIIIDINDIYNANDILIKNGYAQKAILFSEHRHLPRLINSKRIAAVELHKDFLENPHKENFNLTTVKKSIVKFSGNNVSILGRTDKIAINIFSNQLTDNVFKKKTISLRSLYDFILLKKDIDQSTIIAKYPKYQKNINCYFEVLKFLIDAHFDINLIADKKTKSYLKKVSWFADNPKIHKKYIYLINSKIYLKSRFYIFLKSFSNKNDLQFVLSKIVSLDWYKKRFFGGYN
jgi:hypothetical protein